MIDLWKKTLSALKVSLDEKMVEAWIDPLVPLSLTDVSISLGVPNHFHADWVRDHYFDPLKKILFEITGKQLEIILEICEKPEIGPSLLDQPLAKKNTETVQKKEAPVGWLKSVFSSSKNSPEMKAKEIGLKENYTFDNFVVGPGNNVAHAAALAVSNNLSRVYNPLFLYGGVGLGKTHLMQALAMEILKKHPKTRILYVTSEDFTNELVSAIKRQKTAEFRSTFRSVDVLLVDDIQFIGGKNYTQEEFFHTFNALHDAHKQLVICSDRPPREIQGMEERLISRFAWGLIADIQLPDYETRRAILEKKCEMENMVFPEDVICFLAEHVKTNIREMEGALVRVLAYSQLSGSPLSVSLAENVLEGMISSERTVVSPNKIQEIISSFYNISVSDMKKKSRARSVSHPRQVAMFLCRLLTKFSLSEIGGFFGGRDHSTVLHACDKISKEMENDADLKKTVSRLTSMIKESA